jgi:hypothetical protein
VAIYTDSKVTLDSLKNNTKHCTIIEEIRNMVLKLKKQSWTIHVGWVKAHVGIEGNDAADTLAKEATEDEDDRNYVYERKPLSTIVASVKEEGLRKGQEHWERSEKGARDMQILLPKRTAETQTTDSNNTRVLCTSQRTREDKSLLKQIQTNRQPNVPT